MIVLGIETSCDETAASLVKDGCKVLSNVIFSSQRWHKKYGGVVPEIASRHHVEKINYVIEMALDDAGVEFENIDLIGVTKGPGLIGSLLTGTSAAKTIGFVLNRPVIGMNHLQAHLFSSLLGEYKRSFPALGLVASGGHTMLTYVEDYSRFEFIGTTIDDAAGEALDKVAKLVKLGYPGGPIIEKMAERGDSSKIDFPIGLKGKLDFSFSGLKTSVLYYVKEKLGEDFQVHKVRDEIADICASLQDTIVETLVRKTEHAFKKYKQVKSFITGGGVLANSTLRKRFKKLAKKYGKELYLPKKEYCTDNAAMIASLGYFQYRKLEDKDKLYDFNFQVEPSLKLEE